MTLTKEQKLTLLAAVLGCREPAPGVLEEIGRCGESAESELNKADTDALGPGFVAPPLFSNEQRPMFQCPIGNCDFVGTQEELDAHQLNCPPATADDGYTEEEWSDSDTARERHNSITGRG